MALGFSPPTMGGGVKKATGNVRPLSGPVTMQPFGASTPTTMPETIPDPLNNVPRPGSTVSDPARPPVNIPTIPNPALTPEVRRRQQQEQLASQMRSGYEAALPFFENMFGPQMAELLQRDSSLAMRLGFVHANEAQQSGILNNQYGIDTRRIGLNEQSLGINRGSNQRDMSTLEKLRNLAFEDYALRNKDLGVSQGDVTRGLNSNQLYQQLAGQLHGVNERGLAQGEVAAKQDQMSNATARGAVTSRGNVTGLQRIEDEFGNRRDTLDVTRRRELKGLDDNRADLLSNQQRLGIEGQANDVNLRREGVGFDRDKGRLEDQNKQLDIQAKALGLDRESLKNTLNQGLAKLGIDSFMSAHDLMDAMTSNDLQRMGIAQEIFNNALEYGATFGNNGPLTSNSAPGSRAGRQSVDSLYRRLTSVESGGNPNAVNSRTGASGLGQIMPSNWSPWAKEAGLGANAAKTPENQEKVIKYKLGQYTEKYGDVGALVAWYAGPGRAEKWLKNPKDPWFNKKHGNGDEPSVNEYIQRIMGGR